MRDEGRQPQKAERETAPGVARGCRVDPARFDAIVEGNRACLTIVQLETLAKLAAHPDVCEGDADLGKLRSHYDYHAEVEQCPDCSELYEALVTTATAAARAADRAVQLADEPSA